jgi:hypothetical protein
MRTVSNTVLAKVCWGPLRHVSHPPGQLLPVYRAGIDIVDTDVPPLGLKDSIDTAYNRTFTAAVRAYQADQFRRGEVKRNTLQHRHGVILEPYVFYTKFQNSSFLCRITNWMKNGAPSNPVTTPGGRITGLKTTLAIQSAPSNSTPPNRAAAGMVIRRQRPQGKVVFITLEGEFGHIPMMVFSDVYERYENTFKEPFLIVRGRMSRREGTHEIVVTHVRSFRAMDKIPEARNWR